MNKTDMIKSFSAKKCDLLGIGISNTALIDLLLSAGAVINVRDKKERGEIAELADSLEKKGVSLRLGKNYLCDLDSDFIFRSPGIRPDLPEIKQAVARGASLLSETELFCALTDASIIAITGSDGKTTTTTLTHLFLEKEAEATKRFCAYVGGNIGKPLLSQYEKMKEGDFAVLELSSFQLMTLRPEALRAAITNITPNHLNWHTDMEEYAAAKKNVFDKNSYLVLNAEDERCRKIADGRDNTVLFSSKRSSFSDIWGVRGKNRAALFISDGYIVYSDGEREERVLKVSDIKLPGKHNIENYMTAIALTYGLVDKSVYTAVAREFAGVEHRLELVRELHGVKYYNSSIDSSPTRSAAALAALGGRSIVICGGRGKGAPFDTLAKALIKYAKCVILTGEAAQQIKEAILLHPDYSEKILRIAECPDFTDAVKSARACALSGDTVVLSPACTSFDAFKNFEERGKYFKKLVWDFS